MGVNLVTRVRNFSISTETFASGDHSVQDGCVTAGTHKLLRFDFLSHNVGSSDLVIGSPAARPDLFVWSAAHGHYHLKDFNQFLLFDANGNLATTGYKQAFCAIDIERISSTASLSPRFADCNSDQGISAGWADVYHHSLACQFIVLDGVANGDYTLQSTTNTQHKVGEECYGDNTIWTGLRISGNSVTEIPPPYVPEDRIPFDRTAVAAVQIGGRWKVVEGGTHWMIDTGTSQAEAERVVDVINHYQLATMAFVGRPRCGDVQPMMYWLNDAGRAPSGTMAGEDAIAFDRTNLAVVAIGDRWKVVEGTHWLLDFGAGQGNAIAALHFIKKYRFDVMCFVGRPDPSMTYFKTAGRIRVDIHAIDPRRLEAAGDTPTWWTAQAELTRRAAPWADLGSGCAGPGPARRQYPGITIEVPGVDATDVVERHGITGLALSSGAEITLDSPAEAVDLGLAHFGAAPSVTGYAGDRALPVLTAGAAQRQVENLRVSGAAVTRVVVDSPDGEALLTYVRSQPARAGKPRRPARKAAKRATKA